MKKYGRQMVKEEKILEAVPIKEENAEKDP